MTERSPQILNDIGTAYRLGEELEGRASDLTVDDSKTPRFMYTLAAAYAHLEKPREALHYAREAKQRATALGQTKLVAEIDELMKGLGQPKSAP
jgi:hypothetical protein